MSSLSVKDCDARAHGINSLLVLELYQVDSHLRLHASLFPGNYRPTNILGDKWKSSYNGRVIAA